MNDWKEIKDFEGLYEVNSIGQVKSLSKNVGSGEGYKTKEFIMLVQKYKAGYLYYSLCKKGNRKKMKAHRLVAIAFIDNPENKKEVNHIDGNKQNNHVSNLQWCTQSENTLHAYKTGLMKPKKGVKNRRSIPVLQYDMNGNFISRFNGVREAMRETGCDVGDICACCKGKKKHVKKYVWKYE